MMHVVRAVPRNQARAPTNKTPMIKSKTKMTTDISTSVIPDEIAVGTLLDRFWVILRLAGEGSMIVAKLA
jgi:hypothetical protein